MPSDKLENNGDFAAKIQNMDHVIYHMENLLGQMHRWRLQDRKNDYVSKVKELLFYNKRESRMPIEFRSQVGEDLLLWDLFSGQLDGLCVEVGAYDGYNLSPSYIFDAIGWDSLLIEPSPSHAKLCRQRRPYAQVIESAVSFKGDINQRDLRQVEDIFWSGMSFLDNAANSFHQKLIQERGLKTHVVRVPVQSLDEILANVTQQIDFVTIDVEGYELAALEGFNLNKFRPRLLIIEDLYEGHNSEIKTKLFAANYVLICVLPFNMVFIKEEDSELLERARGIL